MSALDVDRFVVTEDIVIHDKFGWGVVTSTKNHGGGREATIDFNTAGSKRLLLRFAPLRIVVRGVSADTRRELHDADVAQQAASAASELELLALADAVRKAPEKDIVPLWQRILEPHFDIETEVPCTHYRGQRLSIDMLLHPRFDWSGGGRHPIGFEVKRLHDVKVGAYVGQAADYAASAIHSARYPDESLDVYVAVTADAARENGTAQLLGGIGVIHLGHDSYNGLTLRCSSNRMWSAKTGPVRNGWTARRKFGAR